MGLIPNIVEHFCAGTWYAIRPEQVKIHKKSWHTETSNVHIQLEIDDAAFKHLKSCNWMSALGLHVITWGAPGNGKFTGYMPPDTNIKQFIAKLNTVPNSQQVSNIPQGNNLPQVNSSNPPGSSNTPQGQQANIFIQHLENQESIRQRHVTGGNAVTETPDTQDPPTQQFTADEEMLSEGEGTADTSLTESDVLKSPMSTTGRFDRDLNQQEVQHMLEQLDNTIVPHNTTPVMRAGFYPSDDKPAKHKRKTKEDGTAMTDPSDSESEKGSQAGSDF